MVSWPGSVTGSSGSDHRSAMHLEFAGLVRAIRDLIPISSATIAAERILSLIEPGSTSPVQCPCDQDIQPGRGRVQSWVHLPR